MLDHLAGDPVLMALPLAAIVTDLDGRILAWNPRAEALFGWQAGEVVGRSVFEIASPTSPAGDRGVLDAAAAGECIAGDFSVTRRDGSSLLAHSTTTGLRDETGRIVAMLTLSEDVTDTRLTQLSQAENDERLRLAIEAGRLGAWEYDATTGLMHVSRRFEEILGLEAGSFGGTYESLTAQVHPEDRSLLTTARTSAMEHDRRIHVEYRIVRSDGTVRWIEGRGHLRLTDGAVAGSIGVAMDITERRTAELQRDALEARLGLQAQAASLLTELHVESRLETLADIIVPALADCCAIHLVADDGRIALAGVRHADPEKHHWFRELLESFPISLDQPYGAGAVIASANPQLLPQIPDSVLVKLTEDRPDSLEGFRSLGLRSMYAVPLISRGRALGSLTLARIGDAEWDADDRALAEQIAQTAAVALDNARLFAAERQARASAERNEARLGLLAEVTTALVASLDLDAVLDSLAGLLVPRLAELCTVDIADDERTRMVAVRAVDEADAQHMRQAETRLPRRLNDSTAVARVMRTGRPLLISEVDIDYLRPRATDDEQLASWLSLDIRSAAVAPISARGVVIGAISLLGLGESGRRFTQLDVDLLLEVGRRAGLALDNARLYSREHGVAEALQRSLLPELQPLPGLDIAARYLPSSEHAQVGGDWFDAFALDDGTVGVAVGDAMGHDPQASGAMGQLRSVLRSYAFEGASPGVVLDKLDRLVQGFSMAQLATVFYAQLEPADTDGNRVLRYSSAGHPPSLLRQPDGTTQLLDDGRSIVIGAALDEIDRAEGEALLRPGSMLVCYTDGLVEGRDRGIDEGIEALTRAVASLGADRTADQACDQILAELVGADRDDDIALLVLRTRPGG